MGIGTTNPQAKLDVNGTIIASTPTVDNEVATKSYVDAASGDSVDFCYVSCQSSNNPTCDSGYTRVYCYGCGDGCGGPSRLIMGYYCESNIYGGECGGGNCRFDEGCWVGQKLDTDNNNTARWMGVSVQCRESYSSTNLASGCVFCCKD